MMPRHIAGQLTRLASPLHDTLVDFMRRRVEYAERRWSQRYDRWRESERLYRAFRPTDLQDQRRADDSLTEGVTKIVVPYSYAVIQSTLAFFMSVLTQRKPLIPVEGNGPADVRAAMLMEVLLDRQMDRMMPAGSLVLYQWLLDSLRYGVGIIKNLWTVREFPQMKREVAPEMDPFSGQPTGKIHDTISRQNVVAYEGNEAINVSPFDFLPDPNRPLADFQRGEFVAHRLRRSWTELRQRQAQGVYVGLEHVPRQPQALTALSSVFGSGRGLSDQARIADMDEIDWSMDDTRGEPAVELIELYAYVDPDALGLDDPIESGQTPPPMGPESRQGDEQGGEGQMPPYSRPLDRISEGTPELWVFTLANGARVIRAEPANLPAFRFPFEIVEINYDVHSPANFGMIETFRGLQYILSWLFNSRMLNVEKTINNEILYDPSMVEEQDVLQPGPGLLIRLKQDAWGNPNAMAQAMKQFPIQDVTQSHHTDAKVVMDLIQQVSAANQLIMGMPNTGRRAATEVQGQMSLASGRMKMLIELVRHQGLGPWADQMAKNTQVFAGDMGIRLRPPYDQLLGAPFVQVGPQMLQGEFSFPFTEAGMPTDRLFEANTWKELLAMFMQAGGAQLLMANPMAAQMLPQILMSVFGRFLHAMNVKDLQTFGLSLPGLVIAPDEQVQQQVQQGNLQGMPAGPAQGGEFSGMTPSDGFAQPPAGSIPNVGDNGQGGSP